MLPATKLRAVPLALAVLLCSATVELEAADNPVATVMTVKEMCGGCVKKITKHLQPMKGIASIQCDIKSKTVKVIPKSGHTLSPKVLWTEMDDIGKTPTKLVGPSGTFTSKPEN
jgi:copper chaperone CopZ